MRTARSYHVALANLQLTTRTRLALCSQRATCLRLSMGMKGVHCHAEPGFLHFYLLLQECMYTHSYITMRIQK